jgi:Spy/CpxP family protein refolding chaperone
MGKLTKRYSHTYITSHDSKIHKYRKYVSATSLDDAVSKKEKNIRENFRKLLRRLMAKQCHNK